MKVVYLMFSYTVGGIERLATDICNDIKKKMLCSYILLIIWLMM